MPGGDGVTVDGMVRAPLRGAAATGSVAELIEGAGPLPGADHGTVVARDDGYRASIPLEDLRRGVLDGGRLTIPGGRTLCWNVKDVVRIELTAGKQPDSVPENPPH